MATVSMKKQENRILAKKRASLFGKRLSDSGNMPCSSVNKAYAGKSTSLSPGWQKLRQLRSSRESRPNLALAQLSAQLRNGLAMAQKRRAFYARKRLATFSSISYFFDWTEISGPWHICSVRSWLIWKLKFKFQFKQLNLFYFKMYKVLGKRKSQILQSFYWITQIVVVLKGKNYIFMEK